MADEVRVRPLRDDDVADVLGLAPRLVEGVASWRDAKAVNDAVIGWVRGSVEGAGYGSHAVLVAEIEAVVVGVVTLSTRQHFAGEVDAYVGELVVDAAAARRGVGRALMTAAEDWARAGGYRRLTLQAGAANVAARDFYAVLGYEEEDVTLSRPLMEP